MHFLPNPLARLLALSCALVGALAVAPSAFGAVGTSLYATGLHISTGSITAPDGRTWVSDHNAGFCRIIDPTPAGPGHIEHPDFDPGTPNSPTDTPTCLGGLLAGAAPGPDASSAPAFYDPTPASPNSGDEKVFVPDGSAPSADVFILGWHPDTGLFTNDGVVTMNADPNRPERSRPLAASLGPDGFVYVGFQVSGTIQRFNPADAQPTAQLVGLTADGRGVGGVTAGFDSAGQTTVYAAERTGVRQFHPTGGGNAASTPVPFAAVAPNAMAYDLQRHLLYLGTANGVTQADAGTDVVQRIATNSNTTETYAIGFSMVGGLDVRADGAVVVVDDDALLDPAEPIGNGKMYVAGLPAARIVSGPTSADGGQSGDREFTNDSTPSFTVAGDPGLECSLAPAGSDPVWAPCPGDGVFTAASALADGGYFFSTRSTNAAGTGIPTGHAFTVDTAAPGPPSVLSPGNGATVGGSPDFAFGGEPGAGFTCSLDDGPFAACEPGPAFAFAADGAHVLRLRSVDRAGNVSDPSAPSGFTVDVSAPLVVIDSPAESALTGRSPQFTYHASEAGARFRCRLDDGAVTACGASKGYTKVAPGTHTFQVGATDAAGNVGRMTTRKIRVGSGNGSVDDGAGSAAELSAGSSALRLGAMSVRRSVSRAQLRRGLRISVTPAKGTKLVRVRLYKVTGKRARLVVTRWMKVRGTKRQALVVRGKAIARLARGGYRLDVTPGTSRTKLGATTQRAFTIVR